MPDTIEQVTELVNKFLDEYEGILDIDIYTKSILQRERAVKCRDDYIRLLCQLFEPKPAISLEGVATGANQPNANPSLIKAIEAIKGEARKQAREQIFTLIEDSSSPANTNMRGINLSRTEWQALKEEK